MALPLRDARELFERHYLIAQITIEPDKGAGVLSLRSGFPLSTTYRLWVKVAGCESNIFMRASQNGRLTSVK